MSQPPLLSIVVPVYNAADFIRESVKGLDAYLRERPWTHELILVDDGSSDATPAILESLRSPQVQVLHLRPNQGKFAALRAGMECSRGEVCLFTDADIPYEYELIERMLFLVREQGFHLVVGDRTLPGSSYVEHLTPLRRMATRAFSLLIRLLVTGGLFDTQCGIKAFRGDVARALFPLLHERGFAGDVELLYVALKYNLAIRRVPARLVRQGPTSVRPFRDGALMLASAMHLPRRFRQGLYRSPALARLAEADAQAK